MIEFVFANNATTDLNRRFLVLENREIIHFNHREPIDTVSLSRMTNSHSREISVELNPLVRADFSALGNELFRPYGSFFRNEN